MSKFHRLLTSKNRCLSYDLGQHIENTNRSIAYTKTHIITFYAWPDFASHTFIPVSGIHMVSCMTQYSTLNRVKAGNRRLIHWTYHIWRWFKLLLIMCIAPRWPSLKFQESGAVLVRPDGYVTWRCQDRTNDQFDYVSTLKVMLKQIQLTV